MICPLSDNFRAVVVKTVSMLRELGWDRTADVMFFMAALDYSEDEGDLLRKVKMYLIGKSRGGLNGTNL
jgi:hypothetical protein